MKLPLTLERDLVFFDVETTGLNVIRDRIVQIGILKFPKNGNDGVEFKQLINPGIPISEESMSIHGFTPKELANKPTFGQVAQKIADFIGNADLAGYNAARFDIPMLIEEFSRVGVEFNIDKRRIIDVQRIFYKMEPRTLRAALKFYCQEDIVDAHDAMADVYATAKVFEGQLAHYANKDLVDEENNRVEAPIQPNIQVLHDFTTDFRMLDATQKLRYDHNGVVVFNFGKYMNQPVLEVFAKDKNYYHWIIEKEFSAQVKQIVKKLVKDNEKLKN